MDYNNIAFCWTVFDVFRFEQIITFRFVVVPNVLIKNKIKIFTFSNHILSIDDQYEWKALDYYLQLKNYKTSDSPDSPYSYTTNVHNVCEVEMKIVTTNWTDTIQTTLEDRYRFPLGDFSHSRYRG